jgi:hypothetical protein
MLATEKIRTYCTLSTPNDSNDEVYTILVLSAIIATSVHVTAIKKIYIRPNFIIPPVPFQTAGRF